MSKINKVITTELGPNVFPHFKGRVSLYLILKAIDIKEGDEVILPAFTCVVVVNAIIYLKAKPVYIDIAPNSYTIDPKLIENKITKKTRAIIAQNSFGLNADLHKIKKICTQNNLLLIEDCAHGFGGQYRGSVNGTLSDAAFFSSQWNKPFSTGLGGYALINNPELLNSFKNLLVPSPSLKSQISLLLIYILKKTILNSWTYWFFLKLFRFLSKKNLILGSSSGEEMTGTTMPKNYLCGMGWGQKLIGFFECKKLAQNLILRKENGQKYNQFFQQHGFNPIDEVDNSFLRYPLLVKDKKLFFKKAEAKNITLGDWFLSPIHPVEKDFHKWQLDLSHYPNATFAANHIINLPMDKKNIKKILIFLTKNLDQIVKTQ